MIIYSSLARYSELTIINNDMKILVHTTGGNTSYINGKIESSNNTLENITRDIFIHSIHNKELWCFNYQYAVYIARMTNNRLHGDVPYLLWYGAIPHYKHMKILGVRGYIINDRVTSNKSDNKPNIAGVYAATTVVLLYWKPNQPFYIHRSHHLCFDG